jgi:hypothetical protein
VEQGSEQFDPGASHAFAVSDHQIAHIYVSEKERISEVKSIVEALDGVEKVLDEHGKKEAGLHHARSGELVAIAESDRWFSYYYWLEDDRAPDYAKTVDIHRKPGYDPVELFINPELKFPMITMGAKLAKRKLGFRNLLNVISLKETTLVKGTHGRPTDDPDHGPLVISSNAAKLPEGSIHSTDFKALVLKHIFED